VAWSIAALAGCLLAAAIFGTHPEWRRHDPPDWRPLFARAQSAASKDRYEARYLYVSAARAALWAEDWRGLVAAACGLKKLDGTRPNDPIHGLLLRAMIAAETRRSREGLAAVAGAFAAMGEAAAAAMVLARAGADWPEEPPAAQEAENAFIANCGAG
jgi:hypothetical protein